MSDVSTTMLAAVLDAPGPPEALRVRRVPVPVPEPGQVLIRVRAAGQVIPFRSELPWSTLGALPEMLQTAYGSLTVGLDARAGQTLLIRGGTSSVGMATAVLAKRLGMTVISTTRSQAKVRALLDLGVDHVVVDDGTVAPDVRALVPDGVEAALELVGAPTLRDTLLATGVHGVVCFTGMLSNQWTVPDFYPNSFIPSGVRLTSYSGSAANLPAETIQDFLDAVAADEAVVPIAHVFELADIAEAHGAMEQNQYSGKLVVVT